MPAVELQESKVVLPEGCVEEDLYILEIRGPVLQHIKSHCQTVCGPEGWEGMLSELSEACRDIFRQDPSVWAWVDVRLVWELSHALIRRVGTEFLADRGRTAAEDHLTSLSAWFMRLASPIFLMMNMPHIWRFFFRGGLLTIDHLEEGVAQFSVWASNGYPEMFAITFKAWTSKALEMAGARDIAVDYQGPAKTPTQALALEQEESLESRWSCYRHRYSATWKF